MLKQLLQTAHKILRSPIIAPVRAAGELHVMGVDQWLTLGGHGFIAATPYPHSLPRVSFPATTAQRIARLIGNKHPRWAFEIEGQETGEGILHIHTSDYTIKTKAATLPWDDLPDMLDRALAHLREHGAEAPAWLADIIIPNDDYRELLQYVTFARANGKIYAGSTDGFRMHLVPVPFDDPLPPLPEFVRHIVQHIQVERFVYTYDVPFKSELVDEGAVLAAFTNGHLRLLLIFSYAIQPPNKPLPVERFLPTSEHTAFPAAFIPASFIKKARMLKDADLIIDIGERETLFRLVSHDDDITLETRVSVGGDRARIALNPHYILDALALGPERMLYLPDAHSVVSPVVFDAKQHLYLVMPKQIP